MVNLSETRLSPPSYCNDWKLALTSVPAISNLTEDIRGMDANSIYFNTPANILTISTAETEIKQTEITEGVLIDA